MDQLKTKLVNVILTIEEGRGMDFIKNPIVLSANFNGRPLESDPVIPKDCPLFNTNLIWEIEKKVLRKIRTSNQPLRIECLTIDEENRRDKIGHVLLDLRSAYIGDIDIPFKWQKLVGMRTKKKNCRPELFLALSITDSLNQCPSNETCLIDKASSDSFGNTPLEYMDDYIKIGDDISGNKFFSLNVLIKFASNLDILLPEILVFHENKNRYCMSFKIFEIPIKTKQFYKDLHEKIVFDEKIVVKLLSTIETIRNFFKNQEIEVSFFSGNDKLGVTTIELNTLMSSCENFLNLEYYFKFPSTNGIVPIGSDGRKPFVHLEISLNQIEDLEPIEIEMPIEEKIIKEIEPSLLLSPVKRDIPKKINQYRLTIKLQDLLMDNKALKYKFIHPKANSFMEIDDSENLQINLIYITTSDENIKSLLCFWPPKLLVMNENNNVIISKEHQIKSSVLDSAYTIDLFTQSSEMITKLKISVKLERNVLEDENTLLPPILDEKLAILEIRELQEWKEMEKIEFENNLMQLKKKMEEEWEKKKSQLDMDFEENMEKCKILQDELQEKINNIKIPATNEISSMINNNNCENCNKMNELEEENVNLKKQIQEQKHELEFFQKTALTKEQTSNLLQELKGLEEKFQMAQKCKNYFKEQWKQTCEEIHELKCEDYKQLQNQIQEHREELDLNFNRVGGNWQQFFVN